MQNLTCKAGDFVKNWSAETIKTPTIKPKIVNTMGVRTASENKIIYQNHHDSTRVLIESNNLQNKDQLKCTLNDVL